MMENWKNSFAHNITLERRRLGIKQIDVAERLGLKSSTTVSNWERGVSFPNLEDFMILCEFFGRTPSQMLGLSDKIIETPPEQQQKLRQKQPEAESEAENNIEKQLLKKMILKMMEDL